VCICSSSKVCSSLQKITELRLLLLLQVGGKWLFEYSGKVHNESNYTVEITIGSEVMFTFMLVAITYEF